MKRLFFRLENRFLLRKISDSLMERLFVRAAFLPKMQGLPSGSVVYRVSVSVGLTPKSIESESFAYVVVPPSQEGSVPAVTSYEAMLQCLQQQASLFGAKRFRYEISGPDPI